MREKKHFIWKEDDFITEHTWVLHQKRTHHFPLCLLTGPHLSHTKTFHWFHQQSYTFLYLHYITFKFKQTHDIWCNNKWVKFNQHETMHTSYSLAFSLPIVPTKYTSFLNPQYGSLLKNVEINLYLCTCTLLHYPMSLSNNDISTMSSMLSTFLYPLVPHHSFTYIALH